MLCWDNLEVLGSKVTLGWSGEGMSRVGAVLRGSDGAWGEAGEARSSRGVLTRLAGGGGFVVRGRSLCALAGPGAAISRNALGALDCGSARWYLTSCRNLLSI